MTSRELSISLATSRLVMNAIKTNLYAEDHPEIAKRYADEARWYIDWLTNNGAKVAFLAVGDQILEVSINGTVLVTDGHLAQ